MSYFLGGLALGVGTNMSPSKIDGWNTDWFPFWDGLFSGIMLVLGCFRECRPLVMMKKLEDQ